MDKYNTNHASVLSSTSHASHECDTDCDAAVVSFDTLPGAENFPVKSGEFKIPKVLAEFVVQIDSEAVIRLNDPAFEIKRVEKQVFLNQCRFIPPTNKVFLEGFIRKNIEYSSKTCSRGNAIGGTIKDTTAHIPFKVFTKVDFREKPQIMPNLPPMVARYFDEKRMGKNIREADRSDVEILNEPVFCELEWTAVFDADIDHVGMPIDDFKNEEVFQEFTDKSVVFICIKLLQKQQVCMHPHDKEFFEKTKPMISNEWNMPMAEIIEDLTRK
ncbi:MAG TPA: hypothetical protein VN258_10470 [Mobilitalea sp.]|nr:hypothetical protein [Mobilitalea sp.]